MGQKYFELDQHQQKEKKYCPSLSHEDDCLLKTYISPVKFKVQQGEPRPPHPDLRGGATALWAQLIKEQNASKNKNHKSATKTNLQTTA